MVGLWAAWVMLMLMVLLMLVLHPSSGRHVVIELSKQQLAVFVGGAVQMAVGLLCVLLTKSGSQHRHSAHTNE